MKVLFFGTPEIAARFLQALTEDHEVVGAVTQPDRPAMRGQKLRPPAVKMLAAEHGIPVFQPERFDAAVLDRLRALGADVGVVVSYGRLIPESVFALPRLDCFNVHFSLLPKYRGAAPMQWALINGETETGVSTFWLEKTLDTGPVLVRKRTAVAPGDDTPSLTGKLTALGIEAMKETLDLLAEGRVPGEPQEGAASYAPALTRDDGKIDWTASALSIIDRIRGTRPWPGAFTTLGGGKLKGTRLKILRAHALTMKESAGCGEDCGVMTGDVRNVGFTVRCGTGFLVVEEVQPENRRPMSAWSFLQGGCLKTGDKLI